MWWLVACLPQPADPPIAPEDVHGFSTLLAVERPANAATGAVPMGLAVFPTVTVLAASAPVRIDGSELPENVDVLHVMGLDHLGQRIWGSRAADPTGQTLGDVVRSGDFAFVAWEAYGGGPVRLGDQALPPGQGSDVIVARFAADGKIDPLVRLGDAREDRFVALAPAADGVYVAWHAEPDARGGPPDRAQASWHLARLTGGAPAWTVAVPDAGHWTTSALAAHPDGGVVVAITTDGGGDPPVDAPPAGTPTPAGLGGLLGEPGTAVGIGFAGGGDGPKAIWVGHYGADGQRRWLRRLEGAARAVDVAAAPDGAVAVVGSRDEGGFIAVFPADGGAPRLTALGRAPLAVTATAGGFLVDEADPQGGAELVDADGNLSASRLGVSPDGGALGAVARDGEATAWATVTVAPGPPPTEAWWVHRR